MRTILFTLISLAMSMAYAKQVKVAVIDTGFGGTYATPKTKDALCKDGHHDYTLKTPTLGYDTIGHGTFVSNIIVELTDIPELCILSYKVLDRFLDSDRQAITDAIVKAVKNGAEVINISMSQSDYSTRQREILKKATKRGVKIFVSAGNENSDLNNVCKNYPVCYKGLNGNFYRVGATDATGLTETYSNKGIKVDVYEYGGLNGVGRGTSFSSPRAVVRYLREKYQND